MTLPNFEMDKRLPNRHQAWLLAPLVPVFCLLAGILILFFLDALPPGKGPVLVVFLFVSLIGGTTYAYLIAFLVFWPQHQVLCHFQRTHYFHYALIGLTSGLAGYYIQHGQTISLTGAEELIIFLASGLIGGLSFRYIAGWKV